MKAGIAIKASAVALLLLPAAHSRSQNVVADWDAIASNAIVSAGKSPAASFVFFAYVDVAV